MYVAWYGLGRAWIEGMRTDSLYLFGTGLRVSQLLAILSCLVAAGLLIYNLYIRPRDPDKMLVRQVEQRVAELLRRRNPAVLAEPQKAGGEATEAKPASDTKENSGQSEPQTEAKAPGSAGTVRNKIRRGHVIWDRTGKITLYCGRDGCYNVTTRGSCDRRGTLPVHHGKERTNYGIIE